MNVYRVNIEGDYDHVIANTLAEAWNWMVENTDYEADDILSVDLLGSVCIGPGLD